MIRQRCQADTTGNQCKTMFRARARHKFCRHCYKIKYGTGRIVQRAKRVKVIKAKVEAAPSKKRK